jgi:hypothetical protein
MVLSNTVWNVYHKHFKKSSIHDGNIYIGFQPMLPDGVIRPVLTLVMDGGYGAVFTFSVKTSCSEPRCWRWSWDSHGSSIKCPKKLNFCIIEDALWTYMYISYIFLKITFEYYIIWFKFIYIYMIHFLKITFEYYIIWYKIIYNYMVHFY